VPRDKESFKLSVLQWGNYICHVQDEGILHHTCLLIHMDQVLFAILDFEHVKQIKRKKEQPAGA
jgi:hypothetical protein